MLEEEYVTTRTSAKKKMFTYVAEQAAVKMDEYLEQLKKLGASLTEQHPVSVRIPNKSDNKMENVMCLWSTFISDSNLLSFSFVQRLRN